MPRRRHIQLAPLEEAQRLFFEAVEQNGFFAAAEGPVLRRANQRSVAAPRES